MDCTLFITITNLTFVHLPPLCLVIFKFIGCWDDQLARLLNPCIAIDFYGVKSVISLPTKGSQVFRGEFYLTALEDSTNGLLLLLFIVLRARSQSIAKPVILESTIRTI